MSATSHFINNGSEDMSIPSWRATCIQMPSKLTTNAASQDAAWSIINDNIGEAVRLIEQALASDLPPKLVVLPEFALQGPPHGLPVAEWMDKAVYPIPGRITAPLQALAKSRGIFIAGNQFESDPQWPGRFFNSCFLIDPKGEVILRFRRINTASWPSPHDFIDDYVAQLGWEGTFPVVDTELGRIALVACGEIAIPEVARCLMLNGAEIILHPTNEDNNPAQEAAKIARAAENMVYVVSANVAGGIGFSADGSVQGGRSRIIDFRGKTLSYREEADGDVSVSAMIDVEALRAARRDTGMANNLLRARWDMYRPFYAEAAAYPANSFLAAPMQTSGETAVPVGVALDRLFETGLALRD